MTEQKRTFTALITTFDGAWANLERRHKVDANGGMQYHRVLREWILEGAPHGVTEFILANRMDTPPLDELPHAVPMPEAPPRPPEPTPSAPQSSPPPAAPHPSPEGMRGQDRGKKPRPQAGPEGGNPT